MTTYLNPIFRKIFNELDLPSVPMGDTLSSAVFSTETGLPYYRILFSIPGMSDRVMDMSAEIKECNAKFQTGEIGEEEVLKLKQKRDKIIEDISSAGLLVNWDILDNIWDKLPGD